MSDLLSDMVSIPRATVERLLAMVEESGFTRRSNFFVKEVVDILALSTPPASPDAGRVETSRNALRVCLSGIRTVARNTPAYAERAQMKAIGDWADHALALDASQPDTLMIPITRLPEGMRHCTILFKECEKGHGWLTATNWIQHGCTQCALDAALATPSAPEDAKGEGVNELVVKIEAKHGPFTLLIHDPNGWRVTTVEAAAYNDHQLTTGAVVKFAQPDLLSALRAAASNTERE